MAFRGICTDAIAKDKIKTSIQTIRIKNVQTEKEIKITFTKGVIDMACQYKVGLSGGINDNVVAKLVLEELHIPEARKLNELKTKIIPDRLVEFSQIVGTAIPFDIDWNTFHNHKALEFFDNLAILRLNMAFRGVCSDEATKELVRKNLKKVYFKSVKTIAETKASFSNGVLSIAAVYDRDLVPICEGLIDDKVLYPLVMKELHVEENQIRLSLIGKVIPERTKEITEIFGSPITYQINWDTFETVNDFNFLDNCAPHRINMAFRCMDATLKGKLQALPLKVIRLINIKDKTKKELKFNPANELQLSCAFGSGLDGCFGDNDISSVLKKKAGTN